MARVALLTSVHTPFDVRIFHKFGKSLADAGNEVVLIVPHDADELVDGVQIKALPIPGSRLGRMTITAWQVYKMALSVDADIYHFHDPELLPIGMLLRAKGKKVIYDVHEHVTEDVKSKPYLPSWSRRPAGRLIQLLENFACPRLSAVVPATPAIAERYLHLNGNCTVVQNFPIAEEFSNGREWRLRDMAVAYVGWMEEARGIRQMVTAMEMLSAALDVSLKLAGKFSPPELRRDIALVPGWSRVEELGFLTRNGVGNMLGNVRAGLLLFHPGGNHDRAQPNKMFEYMSAGIPVIASDFPLWRKIILGIGCGLVVDPLNPTAIAEAIEYLMKNPEEAEAMGRRGRQAIDREYNWESQRRKLLDLYDRLDARTVCQPKNAISRYSSGDRCSDASTF